LNSVDGLAQRRRRALALVAALAVAAGTVLAWRRGGAAAPKGGTSPRALLDARPEWLRARYRPIVAPAGLGSLAPPAPLEPLQRWHLDSKAFKGPLAWCPATLKLAFFRDGWIWVTDGDGSRLSTLWFEPDLAAAGQLAWSDDGRTLWIRADGWRHWLSLRLAVESDGQDPEK
jgi:hypothetical protein